MKVLADIATEQELNYLINLSNDIQIATKSGAFKDAMIACNDYQILYNKIMKRA
jgi:hypothetical protein